MSLWSDADRRRHEHRASAAPDVEDRVTGFYAGELHEPPAEVVVVGARDLVVGRRGPVEDACQPRLGVEFVVHDWQPRGGRPAPPSVPAPLAQNAPSVSRSMSFQL